MKSSLNPLDYIFLMRPILLFPIWIFYLAGVWSAHHFSLFVDPLNISLVRPAIFLALTLIMGAAYILNQLQDIETDRINGKKFLMATGDISVFAGIIESIVLILSGLLFGLYLNIKVLIILGLILIFAGYLYNFPPFIWKDKPVMGLLTNGIGGVLIYSLGRMIHLNGSLSPAHLLVYGLAGMSVTLNTTLPDIEGDKKTGKLTFAVKYGFKATLICAFLFQVGTVVGSFLLKEWILFFPALVVTPFFILALIQKKLNFVLIATKVSVLALMVGVCLFFPWFAILLLIVFFGTKIYYHKRFNFNYPSLRTN